MLPQSVITWYIQRIWFQTPQITTLQYFHLWEIGTNGIKSCFIFWLHSTDPLRCLWCFCQDATGSQSFPSLSSCQSPTMFWDECRATVSEAGHLLFSNLPIFISTFSNKQNKLLQLQTKCCAADTNLISGAFHPRTKHSQSHSQINCRVAMTTG